MLNYNNSFYSSDEEMESSSEESDSTGRRVRDVSDDSSDSFSVDEIPVPINNTFDVTLPATHSYLGPNLEELRGRTILDDGIYMNLPLLIKQTVLFPGQTLPMTIFNLHIVDILKNCIKNDRTFGCVCYGNPVIKIGTTAEIYEYREGTGRNGFHLKAKGRQRFKILRIVSPEHHKISANVKVLPEITLGPPFWDQRLASLDRLRVHSDLEENLKKQEKVENLDAVITPWPAWVYRQYDPARLSMKIRQHLQFLEIRGGNVPKDPVGLSFWVAENILIDHDERLELLRHDCAITRLQRELKYLIEDKIYVCIQCETFIGRQSHMFPMNREGPQGTYVNPEGIIHETITFYHVQGVALSDSSPSTNYSWFPGYAWTIAVCKRCRRHVGWKFTATNSDLRPRAFWGVTRGSLKDKDLKLKRQE